MAVRKTIRRFKPDLLHLHVPNPAVFSALLIPEARKLPWVVHWHADIPLDTRKRSLRLSLSHLPAVGAGAAATRDRRDRDVAALPGFERSAGAVARERL